MDLLRYKVLTTNVGTSTVNSSLSRTQILKVARNGVQQDYVGLLNINDGGTRQWSYITINKRIVFPTAQPFESGEKIYIMYKVTQ